jgi:WD40 repeat protein/DNA-binding SARP family transcriptional activator
LARVQNKLFVREIKQIFLEKKFLIIYFPKSFLYNDLKVWFPFDYKTTIFHRTRASHVCLWDPAGEVQMDDRVEIFTLGGVRILRGGEAVAELTNRKAEALLIYLASTRRVQSREVLADLLWDEHTQTQSLGYLRVALSDLRKSLGGDLISGRGSVALNPSIPLWLDALQLEDCLKVVHQQGQVTAETAGQVEQALELYQGDFLEGFHVSDCRGFEEWRVRERERLHHLAVDGLYELVAYELERQECQLGLAHAARLMELDPLMEAAHRQMMRLLVGCGQRSAALAQYETCQRLLREELGVEPEAETVELYEQIRLGQLEIRAAPEGPLESQRLPRPVGECPYRGLSPFQEGDARFYFGRESFVDGLERAVRSKQLVTVIVGSSGSGKSSALFAGLLPRLRGAGGYRFALFRPGGQPFYALAGALLPLLEEGLSETEYLAETRKLAECLEKGEISLGQVVERVLEKEPNSRQVLLVADQFEELYTLCADEVLQSAFIDELLRVVSAGQGRRQPPCSVLITLRADFMGQALAYRPFADALQDACLMMGPMNRGELSSAIEQPAGMQGAGFEAGLVERILDDVGEKPGVLPLLEFTLTQLWERQADGWLTHGDYEAMGCVEGALSAYAEQVYGELAPEEQECARRAFVQLVQPGEGTEDTRRVATRQELGSEIWGLLQHLADRRLVVTGRDAQGRETVEVVHEALIQKWGRFQEWMQADRAFRSWQERLRVGLRQWQESGEDEGALLRGTPLGVAEGWLAERAGELSDAEVAYIQGGISLRYSLQVEAENQRSEAEAQRYEARKQASIGLAAQALRELDTGRQDIGVLLALEALEKYPYTWQAEQALGQTVLKSRLRLVLQHENTAFSVKWSPDGERLLTASADKSARVWDATTGEQLFRFDHQDQVNFALWSPDGSQILASQDTPPIITVWDSHSGERLLDIEGHSAMVNAARWSPDQDRIATASDDNTARIWDAHTGAEMGVLSGHQAWVQTLNWSPSGNRILTTSGDQTAIIWDAQTCKPVHILSGHTMHLIDVGQWSSSGDWILTSAADGTAKVWDADTGQEKLSIMVEPDSHVRSRWSPSGERILAGPSAGPGPKVYDAVTGEVQIALYRENPSVYLRVIAWSPTGDRVLTALADGSASVWNASSGEELFTFRGHGAEITGYWEGCAVWSPDGQRVATCSANGTAMVWDLSPVPTLLGHQSQAAAFWSSAGDRVLSVSGDQTARVWDPSTATQLQVFGTGMPKGTIPYSSWSPSGDRFIVEGSGGKVTIWDVTTGAELLTISVPGHDGRTIPAWSPDGSLIAVGHAYDGTIRLWDADSGVEQKTLYDYSSDGWWDWLVGAYINVLEWSPSGTRLLTNAWRSNDPLKVLDETTGEILFSNPPSGIRASWSPDESRIASYSYQGLGSIRDAEIGEKLFEFSGHGGYVSGLAWSPTGERFASSSYDGKVSVRDACSGLEVLRYPFGVAVNSVDWSPDGRKILVSYAGKIVILPVWNTTQELIDYAHECCVARELSPEDRVLYGLPPAEQTEE